MTTGTVTKYRIIMIKGIDFKQPKYMLPAILYIPLAVTGYFIVDMFYIETPEDVDTSLQVTEYLNPDLPSANVKEEIGSKMDNMTKKFGHISDMSAVENVENDLDSLLKKDGYQSRLSDAERLQLIRDSIEKENAKKKVDVRDQRSEDFLTDITPEEKERLKRLRENGANVEEIEKLLGLRSGTVSSAPVPAATAAVASADSIPAKEPEKPKVVPGIEQTRKAVNELSDNAEQRAVVKKVTETSSYFNTVALNHKESNMIKAIIDENVKVVEGSRVRLRILDDIEVDGIPLKKGSYVYMTMSGFKSQRVKGKIESIMVGDELLKVSLSIYDTDGLEGLYVPESQFRETLKDVGSQALQGNMNITDGMTTSTSVTQWASQAIAQGYQRISQAVSKAIKKNKVKLKYGTQVYLLNSQSRKETRGNRNNDR